MATIKDVAAAARVSTATVSAVVNDTAYVSPALRARVLEAIRELGYAPSQLARNLRRGQSELIALAVADLANPFYARVVCAAEAAVTAWGYSLVVFNSDEKPEAEKRILGRVRMLHCEGLVLVPVGDSVQTAQRDAEGRHTPTVLFGRTISDDRLDAVTIDNFSASYQATTYLIDLGHTRIGAITGPMHLSTGKERFEGMQAALKTKNLVLDNRFVRPGEFREEAAYSAARNLLTQPERPTAIYVANGLMALGVMRAIADVGLKCPEDISVASTDNIPGIRGLRPALTRTEHPIVDMVNESIRLLIDRIKQNYRLEGRTVVFQPALVVGDSCAPVSRQ
ncbi:MAG TPA: LacI family DNA-binding transcriptional regulator [Roseiarcus sp.]|nr:LacI family DNA-binding transcriptional regulator [Roseiarcus sp.]